MSKLLKNHFFYSSLITIVVLGLIIASYVFGWTTPSANPPDSNLPAPINTGSQDQTKSGGLNIGGNVGIGTTNPGQKLDVVGNIQASQDVGTKDNYGFKLRGVTDVTHKLFYDSVTENNVWEYNAPVQFRFYNAGSPVTRVHIANDGNVGIGTTAPGANLSVHGTRSSTVSKTTAVSKIGGDDVFLYTNAMLLSPWGVWMQVLNDAGNPFPLALNPSGGNVGIGTTSPGAQLEVASTANPGVIIGNGTTGYLKVGSTGWYDDGSYFSPLGGRSFYVRSNVGNSYIYSKSIYLGSSSGTNVYLRGNNISGNNFSIPASGNTYFNNGGNVGIGTTAPKGKLDVAGGISAGTYAGVNTPPSNGMIISGNVGIGTTAPASKLTVAGTIESTSGGIKFPDGTTQTSAVGGCPTGFNDTGYGYCIQNSENTARTWFNASKYCADTFGARLCSYSEWYNACVNVKASGMIGNLEWVDDIIYYDQFLMGLVGLDRCDLITSGTLDSSFSFRCCK